MDKILKVNGKEYKMRLTSWQVKGLEEREQTGLLKIVQGMEDSGSITQVVIKLLHAALLHNHKDLKITEVYDIYDELVEFEGYNIDLFAQLIEDILKTAGLFSGKSAN